MGQNYSNFDKQSIKKFVFNTFENEKPTRLKKRDFFVVGDILCIDLPDEYQFNMCHLGLVYCMDVDKDGRFSQEDLC